MQHGHAPATPATYSTSAWGSALMAAATILVLGGCDSLLNVDNPNNVVQEDLENPSAAPALVNGALSKTANGLSNVLTAHAGISDEFVWRGSFSAMDQLDRGILANDLNRYIVGAFNQISVARWFSDEAIASLEGFDAEGALANRDLLARTYLYAGITYATIPDMFENVAFSDRQEAGPLVGEENMHTLYDRAVEYLDKAVAVSRDVGDADVELAAVAMRARARWAQALWHKLNPPGQTPEEPLIHDADASADAASALEMAPPDWKYRFTFSARSQQSDVAFNANSRLEIAVANEFARQDDTEKKTCTPSNPNCPEDGIAVMDPIDGIKDPALRGILYEFIEGFVYSPLTVVSARELHLILAESALEQSGGTASADFVEHINAVRGLEDELTPYDPDVHTSIEPLDLLKHERKVNLFNQIQRRLADLYRFGEQSPRWAETGDAVMSPGTVFPMSHDERVANCHVVGTC